MKSAKRACIAIHQRQDGNSFGGLQFMRLKLIVAVATAIIVPAYPALAQSSMGSTPETGSLITRRAAQISGSTTTDARRTTREYGECVLRRFPKYGERIAIEPVHTEEYEKMLKRMVIDDCLSVGELSFPLNIVRSAVIEALYFNKFGRSGPTDFSNVPAIDYLADYPAEVPGDARTVLALAKFGDCVGRKDSVNARGLIVSIPGSADETQRFRFLSPSFNGCVVQGEKLTFSKSVIRGAVAEGLYRLSRAASGTAAASR
jgi:hypothetical protein